MIQSHIQKLSQNSTTNSYFTPGPIR